MKLKTAILITCYNRVETTKICLKHCFNAISSVKNFDHDIFLLDDNSPDKTGEIIKDLYPSINIIYGNGKYFWSATSGHSDSDGILWSTHYFCIPQK